MAEDREVETPLLRPSEIQRIIEDEIVPSSSSQSVEANADLSSSSSPVALKSRRLVSLDVFRGLTIALMILVDDAGGAFPLINHSPWFGVTIADFVMPFFLFIVGVSIGLAFKKVQSKSTATKKVVLRAIKLFLLGIFLQGGFFHGRKTLTFGVDVEKIRWFGVLQRISVGYLLASISEIWLVRDLQVDSHLAFLRRYCIQCSLMATATCFVGLHFGQIIAHFQDHMQRMFLWSVSAVPLLFTGYVLMALGMPLSKPLYTISYMCLTAGASGLLFAVTFYVVDVKQVRKPVVLLQWMGMNALIIYALAACEIFSGVLQGFYLGSPENNLVDGTESFLQDVLHSKHWGILAFVLLEILFWGFIAGLLHMKRIYVKL